jgi:predicted RNA-binding Zn ribbon-like protein
VNESWRGYHLSGGHVALDLANTVSWRGDPARRFDRLDLPGFLSHWLQATGIGDPGDLTAVVPAMKELRELVYEMLVAERPDPADLARFGELLAAAHTRAVPSTALPVRWSVPVASPADVLPALILRTDELLRSPDVTRVGQCEGRACAWLFVDTTRNHSRRWCRTDDCGNRERARRHYRKSRVSTDASAVTLDASTQHQ